MEEMRDKYGLSTTAVIATGCVTVLTVAGLLKVKQESLKRKSNATSESPKEDEAKKTFDKSKYPGGQITIYYATQTGTSESFAQQLEREGPDHGFHVKVEDMEEITIEDILTKHPPFGNSDDSEDSSKSSRAIILAATYGEGEPTDNSIELVNEIKECLDQDSEASKKMNGLEYCVFGLGNRQYEHFNAMGKFFDSSLDKLGANKVMELGVGDDDQDLEADFETWKDQMWTQLRNKYCSDAVLPKKKDESTALPDCEYEIVYHDAAQKAKEIPLDQVHGSCKPYFTAVDCPISAIKELRSPKDGGSTKHVEIDIANSPVKYQTADNFGVLPLNSSQVVQSVADSLGYDLDQVFSLKSGPNHEWHGAPFPMPITVREVLTRHLDLTAAPRRSDLKLLVQYAQDVVDRKALQRLSSKEGKKEYKKKIMESYVGVVDLLKLCPSLQIPLEHFISICHFLLPRFYTIASSSSKHPHQVHLTVAVTQDTRKDGSVFQGVCSTHLANLSQNSKVRVFNRPSTFRLPADASTPIIMIGPGTGIAPMRALLQERQYQKAVEKKNVGANILYFGCKKNDLDYLYKQELEEFQSEGTLTDLHLAFSRQQKNKVYVQHLLQQNASETWKLLDSQKAYVYVCGGVKMGHDVTEALKEIVTTQGKKDAKEYLAQLASEGRLVQELWA